MQFDDGRQSRQQRACVAISIEPVARLQIQVQEGLFAEIARWKTARAAARLGGRRLDRVSIRGDVQLQESLIEESGVRPPQIATNGTRLTDWLFTWKE